MGAGGSLFVSEEEGHPRENDLQFHLCRQQAELQTTDES